MGRKIRKSYFFGLATSFLLAGCPYGGSFSVDQKELEKLSAFELTSGETYKGGSREAEIAEFLSHMDNVAEAFRVLNREHKRRNGRVFHDKSHGCLTGKLRISNARAQDPSRKTFIGMFSEEKEFDVIGRFSNGVGWIQEDAHPDVRGLALKVFLDEGKTADFLMTNSTNPLGRDHAHFVEFMKANVESDVRTIGFALRQGSKDKRELPYLRHFARSVFGVIESMATERYWSGHPYTLGRGTHMKFNVAPVGWSNDDQLKYERRGASVGYDNAISVLVETLRGSLSKQEDYLRTELKERARAREIRYEFLVQLFNDEDKTPVENALVDWKEEDAPSIPVAELIFEAQEFDRSERDAECEKLSFSPAHYHPDHRPTGNLGRGRIYSYLASQMIRGADQKEPDPSIVQRWRDHHYRSTEQN